MSKAEESSKKRSRRNLNFSTDEISALIQVWGSPEIQRKFSLGLTRHTILYQEISAFMNAMGFDREADALQTKIANLKSKFYVKKNTSSKSGSSPSSWIHYDDMNRVLGSRPLANDGCVSDSLRTTVEDDPLLGSSEIEEYLLLDDGTDDNTGCSTSLPSGSSNSDASSSSISLDTMPRQAKNTFVVRKTKRRQSDNTLLHKLLENDDKLIKLTEKRMKLEDPLGPWAGWMPLLTSV